MNPYKPPPYRPTKSSGDQARFSPSLWVAIAIVFGSITVMAIGVVDLVMMNTPEPQLTKVVPMVVAIAIVGYAAALGRMRKYNDNFFMVRSK